eukprot:gene22019-29079_t
MDSLASHHLLPPLLSYAQAGTGPVPATHDQEQLNRLLREMNALLSDHHRDAGETLFKAYKCGSYSKVLEFVAFRERLKYSHTSALAKAEASLLVLSHAAVSQHLEASALAVRSACLALPPADAPSSTAAPAREPSQQPERQYTSGCKLRFNEDLSTRPAWYPPTSEASHLAPTEWWSGRSSSTGQGYGRRWWSGAKSAESSRAEAIALREAKVGAVQRRWLLPHLLAGALMLPPDSNDPAMILPLGEALTRLSNSLSIKPETLLDDTQFEQLSAQLSSTQLDSASGSKASELVEARELDVLHLHLFAAAASVVSELESALGELSASEQSATCTAANCTAAASVVSELESAIGELSASEQSATCTAANCTAAASVVSELESAIGELSASEQSATCTAATCSTATCTAAASVVSELESAIRELSASEQSATCTAATCTAATCTAAASVVSELESAIGELSASEQSATCTAATCTAATCTAAASVVSELESAIGELSASEQSATCTAATCTAATCTAAASVVSELESALGELSASEQSSTCTAATCTAATCTAAASVVCELESALATCTAAASVVCELESALGSSPSASEQSATCTATGQIAALQTLLASIAARVRGSTGSGGIVPGAVLNVAYVFVTEHVQLLVLCLMAWSKKVKAAKKKKGAPSTPSASLIESLASLHQSVATVHLSLTEAFTPLGGNPEAAGRKAEAALKLVEEAGAGSMSSLCSWQTTVVASKVVTSLVMEQQQTANEILQLVLTQSKAAAALSFA